MAKYLIKLGISIFLLNFLHFSFAAEPDDQLVGNTLKKIFDKPTAPLAVDAIAVAGNFSLASWSQETKAGRALLRKKSNQWEIVVCGGKDLKKISALAKAGVPSTDAELLVSGLSKAELKLPASLQKRFDSFSTDGQQHHKGHE